jgi:hypothetical protein
MAEGPKTELSEREARTERPPLTAEQLIPTPEFRHFKKGMRKILKLSKAEIDQRVELARERSSRLRNKKT